MLDIEFGKNKQYFMNLDRGIKDIEIIRVFGGGWRDGKQEMLLRVVYRGGKRLFTTVHEGTYSDELTKSIYETRTMFREQKLERILDGV